MWSLTYLIPEVMFAWAPVQRFLVATRARTDLPKARVLLYLVQLVWYVYSKKHLQEGGISNGKLWSCNHQIHSVPSAKKTWWLFYFLQHTCLNFSPPYPFQSHPRLWGTLPNLSRLCRPIDIKQLRDALARTGRVWLGRGIQSWSWACWPLSHLIWWSTSRLFLLSAWGSQTPALLVASLELVHVFQVGWFDSKHHDGEAILIDVVPIKHIQHCPWGILALTNYHRLSQLFRCNEYLMAKFIIHISRHNIPLMYPLFNHCPWATRTGVTLVKKTIDKHGRTRIATWLWLGLWALLNLISGVLTMVLSYTFFPKT